MEQTIGVALLSRLAPGCDSGGKAPRTSPLICATKAAFRRKGYRFSEDMMLLLLKRTAQVEPFSSESRSDRSSQVAASVPAGSRTWGSFDSGAARVRSG